MFADSGVLDSEAATDFGEREPVLIQTDRFINLRGGHHPLPALNSMAVQDSPDRAAVKTELLGKLPHVAARKVFGDEVGLLGVGEVSLRVEHSRCLEWLVIREQLPRVTLQEPHQGLTSF
jgi:hypothetical protein